MHLPSLKSLCKRQANWPFLVSLKKLNRSRSAVLLAWVLWVSITNASAQDMPSQWSRDISHGTSNHPDDTWFRNAKFGIFIHWGLYSEAGNVWNGKDYFGSSEWLMHRAQIPVHEYERLASHFNPTKFNADEWAQFIHDSGAQYVVITAKHHEGFAMYKSNVSPYNIVDATPYHRDPMKALSGACRERGIHFGFYYSQYLDWHEPNGGGNDWDFNPAKRDVKRYYAEKSMPQIRELARNYGPLDILWFDMPGGLSQDETRAFVGDIRRLQPKALISSRVGEGFGDFSDLGDSELPAKPISGAWESLFTHTDSWGFQKYDENFKSPREVIQLLVSTSARGGNLILNVGPDGEGKIPAKSEEYLRLVGNWLAKNGESIYGTTESPFPDQPWGAATTKPGHLYLHVLHVPRDGIVYVPYFEAELEHATLLHSTEPLAVEKKENALSIHLPSTGLNEYDTVIDVGYKGTLRSAWGQTPSVVSRQFLTVEINAANAALANGARLETETSSRYFGNWKHDVVISSQKSPEDVATFHIRFLEPGDYRISLDYAADAKSKDREGVIEINGEEYRFQALFTLNYDTNQPIVFIRHAIGVVSIDQAGQMDLKIHPRAPGAQLFWLRRVVFEPLP